MGKGTVIAGGSEAPDIGSKKISAKTRREYTKTDLSSHMLHQKMRGQGLESRES